MGFGDRFNEHLIKQDKPTLSPEEIESFNKAGDRVAKRLRKNAKPISEQAAKVMANLVGNLKRNQIK